MENIIVLGAGTWGITLARLLANKNYDVTVWSCIKDEVENLEKTNKHPNLPNMILPKNIKYTFDINSVIDKDIIVLAVPSVFVRSTMEKIKNIIKDNQIIVCVAKGIEDDTLYTMSEVINDVVGNNVKVVALSGPTHAEEVSLDMPTSIVSACPSIDTAVYIQNIFTTKFLRVYINTDIKGVELCGSIKNVLAIACGISNGLGYGDNAKAALITRGICEMARLGKKLGCESQTFNGLTGIGDLIVTATSMHSRNNRFGMLIGKGYSVEDAKKEIGMVVEGLNSLKSCVKLATKYNVDMPIVTTVNDIIYNNVNIDDAVNTLFNRELKFEF